ncbi:MAG TPA: GNAT family N-acetyltransferase [Chloroflexota bacterium]|nr:GNAT family N-acetyltransferase [Chloroflexota bacterium]
MAAEIGARSARLALIPLTLDMMHAADHDREGLSAALLARIPDDWPRPDLAEALPFFARLLAHDPTQYPWFVWVIVKVNDAVLVGDIGFRGPPMDQGMVELGYSVLPAFQGQGIASEAAVALVAWLDTLSEVRLVIARTEPDNLASQGVLRRVGMAERGMEDGLIRWEFPLGVGADSFGK